MRPFAPVIALLLAACTQASTVSEPSPVETTRGAVTAAERSSLAGRWRLIELDGKTGTPGFGIDLVADDGMIWWEPACAGQNARYALSGSAFHQLPSRDPAPRAVCDIGYPQALLTVWEVVAAADRVEPAGEGTVRLVGGGRSLVLRRLPDPPLAAATVPVGDPDDAVTAPPEAQAQALPPPPSLRGNYRVAAIDGGEVGGARGLALQIGQDRIEFDNCQQIAWRYRYQDGRLATERPPAVTNDIRPKPSPCAEPLPAPEAAMVAAIDAADRAARTASNGILLSGGGHGVLLFSQ